MILKMSWRNLWRNRRRTLLTVAAIGLGLTVLITMVSFTEGMMQMMVEQVAKSSMGHVQLHHPEYLEKKTVRLMMKEGSRLTDIVRKVPGVEALSARLLFSGSIRSSTSSTVRVVRVAAVDPKQESQFSALAAKVVQGGFVVPPIEALDNNAPERVRRRKGILLGIKLAQQLKVELGSKVRVDTAGFHGATTAAAFYVTGIMKTGTDAFDKQMVLVSLADMQEVTGAGDAVHEISIMAREGDDLEALSKRVDDAVAAANGDGAIGPVQTLPWYKVSPDLKQMMDMSSSWTAVLYLLMLVILSAGILTTMFMVVFERRREFGVQLALGIRPHSLFAGVMLEALLIASLACAVGLAVGTVAVAWLVVYGLDLSYFMEGFEFSGLFIENVYMGAATAKVFVEPTVVVFIGTVLFALWPAMKVARMKALDAIRQGGTTH
jgi:putative ABC transport system permease protein